MSNKLETEYDVAVKKLIKFGDVLRGEVMPGAFTDKLIEGEYLPPTKTEKALSNQEVIDIIKKVLKKDTGSKASVTQWISGDTIPKLDMVVALAYALGVSVDWLLGRHKVPSIELQATYEPFKQLGISKDAWEILNKYKNYLLETSKQDGFIPDNDNLFELYDEQLIALNMILEHYVVENGKITFPILKGLYSYLDIAAQQPFLKMKSSIFDFFSDKNAAVTQTILSDSDFYKPLSAEEIEEYISEHNLFCSPDEKIDIDTFNPDEDKKCDYYIKSKRISNGVLNLLKEGPANLGEADIEEMDANAFYQLKLQLSKLKAKKIKEQIEELNKKIKFYKDALTKLDSDDNENNNTYIYFSTEIEKTIKEIDRLNELLSYYEKN